MNADPAILERSPERAASLARGKRADPRALATREKIILAAEKLFGERGIDAVTTREILEAAHQKNNASIRYHFGDRDQLLTAIFEYREAQIEHIRNVILEEVENNKETGNVRSLLKAMYNPYFLLYRDNGGIHYIRLLMNYLLYHRHKGVFHPVDLPNHLGLSHRRTRQYLVKRLSFLDEQSFNHRLEAAGAVLLTTLIQHSMRGNTGNENKLMADTWEMMVAVQCALPGEE